MENKIVELIIDNIEEAGVDIISFVDNPAIQLPFLAFNDDTDDLTQEQLDIIAALSSDDTGEVYGTDAIFIDPNKQEFAGIGDYLKGIIGLDILGKRGVKQDEPGVEVFRYAGPIAERGFCKAMLRLNKVYREDELRRLNTANPGMGPNGSNTYDVFEYKGSVNCRHYWEKLIMFKGSSTGQTVFISRGPAAGNAGKSNNSTSQSPSGAVPRNARFSGLAFADEEQRVVTGPAMVPNLNILRRDENGDPYYVYFTEETVRQIAEKIFREGKNNRTNVNHEGLDESNTLIESWLVEDPQMDKAKALGFSVPKGTLMVSYRVNNDETWTKIKSGELRGFSVEGNFIDKAMIANTDTQLAKILDILDKISE